MANRYEQLSNHGDPLERLNSVVDWKIFLPLINRPFYKARKSSAGRKPFNRLMMFKVLLLQGLYNLSDAQTEYQIKDRLSFMRFLGLSLGDAIPDEKTIWAYREVAEKMQRSKRAAHQNHLKKIPTSYVKKISMLDEQSKAAKPITDIRIM